MSKTVNDEIEKLIEQQVGIKPGANDLTPMDYLECKTIAEKYADQRVSDALNEAIILIKNETNMTIAESIAKYRIIPKLETRLPSPPLNH